MTTISLPTAAGRVEVTVSTVGDGQPVLLLHGGAGPQSVTAFADLLADTYGVQVLLPTHPGFGGTPRPETLTTIGGLAALYLGLLEELDLVDVTVVGNSIGGWIAAEIALLASPRVSRVVLVDAVGLALASDPIADFFSLTMDQVAELSYADPNAFRIDVEAMPELAKATMAGNRAALALYGGTTMADDSLLSRLPAITAPVLVVWGPADRIVPPSHGKAYAAAIPNARLVLVETAGHLPQIEQPVALAAAVGDFVLAQV